jgi:DNA-binding MarR family transcriptional regulator
MARIIRVPNTNLQQPVEAVRHFNRFYTRQIGVLREGLLRSPFSLSEVRVLYELAHREKPTAAALGKELGLDPGYLSRILRAFEKRGLVRKTPSGADGRQNLLRLTRQGQETFATLNARQSDEIAAMLRALSAESQKRLVEAMHAIEGLLGAHPEKKCEGLVSHASPPARRYGLDRPPPRRPLRPRVRI